MEIEVFRCKGGYIHLRFGTLGVAMSEEEFLRFAAKVGRTSITLGLGPGPCSTWVN